MFDNTIKFPIAESDRKANMDVIETNKVANKEEIRRLRDGNKEFRQKLVTLQKVCYFFFRYHPLSFSNSCVLYYPCISDRRQS